MCNDVTLLTTVDLLEVELASRAQEDEEERRKQRGANMASASYTQKGGGKGKPKPICRDFMTDSGCPKGGQCLYQHPNTVGRCLRCGSTKHVVADCKRPRRDPSATNKGKGRSTSSTSAKSSSSQAKAKAKSDPKKKAAPKGKGKPKPQAKASASAASSSTGQAHTAEIIWAANATEDIEMFETDAVFLTNGSSTTWSYSACSFYTTFTPAFHSSEPTDENGILPPILDTGATHCLLPLSWLTNEQSLSSKKIHLKVASGATVRALLYQNVIYCATVSRPLISVGQLKAMLDLRMVWDDSSPTPFMLALEAFAIS